NPPRAPRSKLASLVADPKAERAAEHDPELLVLVPVLGHDRAGIQLDGAERDPLAVHGSNGRSGPDLLRGDGREVGERRHGSDFSGTAYPSPALARFSVESGKGPGRARSHQIVSRRRPAVSPGTAGSSLQVAERIDRLAV